MRSRPLIAAVVVAVALCSGPPAFSGSSKSDTSRAQWLRELERLREERERAREEARQERERARAEAARAREQARLEQERARAEAERQRDIARQAAAKSQSSSQSGSSAASASQSSGAPKSDGTDRSTASTAAGASRSTAAAGKTPARAKVDDDDDDDDQPAKGGKAAAASAATSSSSATATSAKKSDEASSRSKTAEKPSIFSAPPETVAEALKLLFGSGSQSNTGTATAPAAKPATAPAAAAPTFTTAARTNPAANSGSTPAGSPPPTSPAASRTPTPKPPPVAKGPPPAPIQPLRPGEFRPHEVLAVNLSPEALERARQSGMTVAATVSVPGSNISVSRIILPPGMPRHGVRGMLDPNMPEHAFAMNRVYRLYHAATSTELKMEAAPAGPAALPAAAPRIPGAPTSTPQATVEAATSAPACAPGRCYGATLVQWQPHLAGCTRDMRVGVIDTGVDRSHPALRSARLTERAFTPDGHGALNDGHGTGVVALLAGHPQSGTPGLVPDAQFYVANVFGADERGRPVSDTFSLLKAIAWLSQSGVKIANVSLSGPHDPLLEKAIEDYTAKGMTFIAAAGNEGPTARPSYPAAYPQVIAVTAVDRELKSYRHANRGSYIDVAAPGVGVWTAMPGSREGPMTGTSFAVPYVTAMVASVHAAAPRKSKHELLSLLATRDLGPDGQDPIYGRGLLLAPSSCRPGEGQAVARASQPWAATIMRASATPGR
jgi:hypothetical protein